MFVFVALSILGLAAAQRPTQWHTGYEPPPLPADYKPEPNTILLGGLFPFRGALGGVGRTREAFMRFALDEINREQKLLPGKQIKVFVYDTQTDDRTSLRSALTLCDEFKVPAILGDNQSDNSVASALITGLYGVPQLSYASSSTTLSDKARFPTFMRTNPSTGNDAVGLSALCFDRKWKRIVSFNTDDSYGVSLVQQFSNKVAEKGVTITQRFSLAFTGTAEQLNAQIDAAFKTLNPARDKVFYLLCNYNFASKVIVKAKEYGFLTGKHQFISVQSTMVSAMLNALAGPSLTGTNLTTVQQAERYELTKMANGLIGTSPAPDDSELFNEMLQRWYKADPTKYLESGVNNSAIDNLGPYAYDAMYVYANALSKLVARNATINGTTMLAEVKKTNFTGVTGHISFDQNGDRIGASFDVTMFFGDGKTTKLLKVGKVTGEKITLRDTIKWTNEQVAQAPDDSVECPALTRFTESGSCAKCDSAFYFDNGECKSCASGYAVAADGVSCQLVDGIVALIVVIAVLVTLLIVAAVVFAILRHKKRQRELELSVATAPAEIWPMDEEAQETADISGKIHSTLGDRAFCSVTTKAGDTLTFGLPSGSRMPIMQEVQDEISIRNDGTSPLNYTVHMPDGAGTFELSILPGRGVVKPNSTRTLVVRFKLTQTMKLSRFIKIEVAGAGTVFLALQFEGEISQRIDADELELFGEPLGVGAFGAVYRGRYRGSACAVKVLRRQAELKPEQTQSFVKEIELFQKLRNPFIVNFVGASYVPGKLCLCTELLERGTVLDLLRKAKVATVLKFKIMFDTASALEFLHGNGVIYRDLKPDNLLVFSVAHRANVNIKLADFGTARSVENPMELGKYTTAIGTPIYMAPELMNASPYNSMVDVYSLGMVMWEIMAEKHPFNEIKRVWDLPRLVMRGMRPAVQDDWPSEIRNMIQQCWLMSSENRPAIKKLVAKLSDVYEDERKNHEKGKKAVKKFREGENSTPDSSVGTPTANTGNLEELINEAANQPDPKTLTSEGKKLLIAADAPGAAEFAAKAQANVGADSATAAPAAAPEGETKKKRRSKK